MNYMAAFGRAVCWTIMIAILSTIFRHWIVALPGSDLITISTSFRACTPWVPFTPASINYKRIIRYKVPMWWYVRCILFNLISEKKSLPGQWTKWQLLVVLLVEPLWSQSRPPYSGTGLLHCRVLIWSPFPQVSEQELHEFHPPQPPSTIKELLHILFKWKDM